MAMVAYVFVIQQGGDQMGGSDDPPGEFHGALEARIAELDELAEKLKRPPAG
jgi:hypothetical protein